MLKEGDNVAAYAGDAVLYTATVTRIANGFVELDTYPYIKFRTSTLHEHPNAIGRYIRKIERVSSNPHDCRVTLDAVVELRKCGIMLSQKAYRLAEHFLYMAKQGL